MNTTTLDELLAKNSEYKKPRGMKEIKPKNIIRWLISYFPSLLLVYLLLKYFPHTGLGRIVALPITLLINAIILVVYEIFSDRVKRRYLIVLWPITIILTLLITLIIYPQDDNSSVLVELCCK